MKKNGYVLRVKNLSVVLGRKVILKNVNVDVKEGEMLGVVGVSGVGKTTLLNSIIGYYPLHEGIVSLYSSRARKFVSVHRNLNNIEKYFGISAQNPSFYPELSVRENLEYFASLYGMPGEVRDHNIRRVLKLVQLEEDVNMQAKKLSGGMQKRLDIACAIVHNPKILILDEPTSDIDPLLRVQIWNVMENINKNGTTILIASHFLSEVEHTCDRIVFLRDKRVEFIGTPKEFRNLYSKIKEIKITTNDGRYDLILKNVMDMPFLEVKQIFKKKGSIVLHTKENEKTIQNALSKLFRQIKKISDVEITNPSMDMLFKLFAKK